MASNLERAREIFLHAVGRLPADQWDGYVAEACSGNVGVAERVRQLLRAHVEAGSFLEGPAVNQDLTLDHPAASERPGTVIGPYKLLEQIGEGGFGTVFMAEQTEPIRRKVALKVLKPGMDSRQGIARFEAERQALAIMDHPNIAKVFDGGVTPSGRLYFVMELVKGVPVTQFCDEQRQAPRERLSLFVQVCHAVQHAHQKGVIHRDLKPSNVLVTMHDATPVVKVIDFGVAKAVGQELTDKTLFTGFAQMIGTPLYMSPEQAGQSGLDIDTRSDIYSLGVLLYELLTGTTPFSKERFKQAAYEEIRRIIREEDPPRPSTRLSESKDALPSVAAQRQTEPARLTKLVRGELDWIVMKALEKDRSRRYETANGFAMDVQRYLADEAVFACPPSAAYRVRKFVRRNRRALVTTGLLVAMLLVLAGGFGWVSRDRAAQRGRAAEGVATLLDQCEEALRVDQADRAAVALEAAERRAADGGTNDQADRLARCRADLDLLRGLNEVDIFRWTWSVAGQPERKKVVDRWRTVLTGAGLSPDVERAQELADRINGSPIRDRVLTALDWWQAAERSAGLRAVLTAADPDPYREAIRSAVAANNRRAVADLAARPEALSQPARFAAVLGNLGGYPVERERVILESALRNRPADLTLLMTLCDTYPANQSAGAGERVRWAQAALAVQPTNPAVRNRLGIALLDHGSISAGVFQFREALRLSPGNAIVHTNLGNALVNEGNLPGAIAEFREAVRISPTDENAHNSLGVGLMKSNDLAGAVVEFREAVRLDPEDAGIRRNLATTLMLQKNWAEAAVEFRKAIDLDSTDAYSFHGLGNVLDDLGDRAGSVAAHREAVRLEPTDANWRCGLAEILTKHGDLNGAIAEYQTVLRRDPKHAVARAELWDVLLEKKDVDTVLIETRAAIHRDPSDAPAHYALGRALNRKKDLPGAIAAYREAARLEPDKPKTLRRLGGVLADSGDFAEAVRVFREAVRLDPDHVRTRAELAEVLADRGDGDLDEALIHLRQAIKLNPKYAPAYGTLGSVLYQKGDQKGAIAAMTEAVALDPTDADYRSSLGGVLGQTGDVDEALTHLWAAICLRPKSAQAHNNLGAVLCDRKKDYLGAIVAFREAIHLAPTDDTAHFNLGNALKRLERLPETVAAYRTAVRIDPTNAGHINDLAWLLATGPAEVRDGKQAVEYAIRACELTKEKNPSYLDTLAAAYAAAGNFDKAIDYQKKTLAVPAFAKKHGKECGERLALYERKQAYRDPRFAPRESGPPPRLVKTK